MKRYCGGERPNLLLDPVNGIFLVELLFPMSTASVTGNSRHGDTVQLQTSSEIWELACSRGPQTFEWNGKMEWVPRIHLYGVV